MTHRAAVMALGLALGLALVLAGCTARTAESEAKPAPVAQSSASTVPGTQTRTITFTRGERRLETTIVAPEAPGRYPVVLFGHGLSALPAFYGKLLEHWAEAGFVVAAPAFPSTMFGAQRFEVRDVPNQPADLSTVLDGLLALAESDPLRQRLDPDSVAAAGHSAGAISALGVFTADGPEGRDKRIDAGIILAGSSLGVGERFTGVPVPLLFVHAEKDPVVSTWSGRAAFKAVPWPKAFLTLPGSEHVACYLSPGDPHFATVTKATTDFLRWSLRDDGAAYDRLIRTDGLQDELQRH